MNTQGDHPQVDWDFNTEMDMWENQSGEAHYRVYRALTTHDYFTDESFELLATVDHDVNTYTDDDMYLHVPTYNRRAHYVVRAVDIGTHESLPSDTVHCIGLYHPESEGDPLEIGKVNVPCEFTYSASPNPFNPTTTINFSLPEASLVNLAVYNTNGRQVAQLANGLQEAGQHQVTFDGSRLSSGVYLYRLTAGVNSATGKMVLLK